VGDIAKRGPEFQAPATSDRDRPQLIYETDAGLHHRIAKSETVVTATNALPTAKIPLAREDQEEDEHEDERHPEEPEQNKDHGI
jgi:hypothetical protein